MLQTRERSGQGGRDRGEPSAQRRDGMSGVAPIDQETEIRYRSIGRKAGPGLRVLLPNSRTTSERNRQLLGEYLPASLANQDFVPIQTPRRLGVPSCVLGHPIQPGGTQQSKEELKALRVAGQRRGSSCQMYICQRQKGCIPPSFIIGTTWASQVAQSEGGGHRT
jgi:hypothetical protein